jgi:molybdenum cofactor guanylyltransferase
MQCYVLVGGRSRRMGQSKTTLFLPRVLAAARPVFDEVLAVQRPGGEPADGIETIFETPHAGGGAIFGLVTALRHAPTSCFVLAVDYPFVTADALRFLAHRGGIPIWDGEPQPLCARWDVALLPLIERRIAAGRFDLRSLLAKAGLEMIAEGELRARLHGEPLRNVNTPAELEEAEKGHC